MAKNTYVLSLPLDRIRLDGGTQMRARIDDEHAGKLALRIQAKVRLPLPVVFCDGDAYWLADGFHRHRGHQLAGERHMEVEVREGTQRDAILFAVGANDDHGLNRKPEDIERACFTMFRDREWGGWSNREIASQVGVGRRTVDKYRALYLGTCPDGKAGGRRKFRRGGKIHRMKVPESPPEKGPDAVAAAGPEGAFDDLPPDVAAILHSLSPADRADLERLARDEADEANQEAEDRAASQAAGRPWLEQVGRCCARLGVLFDRAKRPWLAEDACDRARALLAELRALAAAGQPGEVVPGAP